MEEVNNMNPMMQKNATDEVGVCPKCGYHLLYEPHTNFCRWCGCELNWVDKYRYIDRVVIMMIGAPCSGKSTIGKAISDYLGIRYVSSGDIARAMAEKDADVKDALMKGLTAPEDAMRDEVKKIIEEGKSLVLDGFPRFDNQLSFISLWANRYDYEMIFVTIDSAIEELVRRNERRGRDDKDNFHSRMMWYMDNTMPMVYRIENEYGKHNIRHPVGESIANTCNKVYNEYNRMLRRKSNA